MQSDSRPIPILYVDDRPTRLTRTFLERRDVVPVMLRFASDPTLPLEHLRRTENLHIFTFDPGLDFRSEIERLKLFLAVNRLALGGFLNHSEPAQILSHRIARHLGLDALTEESALLVRDKQRMKIRFRELGFRTAEYRRIHSIADVAAFARTVGYPVIIKPLLGFACLDTVRVNSESELDHVNLGGWLSWIVESFVSAREWEICALVLHGEVLAWFPSYMPAPPIETLRGAMNANISAGPSDLKALLPLGPIVEKLVEGFHLGTGYLHMELFFENPENVTLGEIGLRLAGCEIPANHGVAYGFDIYNSLIDIHLGRRPEIPKWPHCAAGDLLLPAKAGRIHEITPIHKLKELPGVLEGSLRFKAGDDVQLRRASHFCAGYVHIVGDSISEVEARMRNTLDSFQMTTVSEATQVSVAVFGTAFGFGPVSKAVAIAQYLRAEKPATRLAYFGSGQDLNFAIASGIFNEIVDTDVDTAPTEELLERLQDFDVAISIMNEAIPPCWGSTAPPLLMVDSLAWLWAKFPPGVRNSTSYFVQDYMLRRERLVEWSKSMPLELVGPILTAAVAGDERRIFHYPYVLLNFNGSASFIQSQTWFEKVIYKTIEYVLACPALKGRKIVAATNGALAERLTGNVHESVQVANFPIQHMTTLMRDADVVLAAPGITSTLEAVQAGIAVGLLLPFNYSQALLGQIYDRASAGSGGLSLGSFGPEFSIDEGLPEGEGVRRVMVQVETLIDMREHAIRHRIDAMLSGHNLLRPSDVTGLRLQPSSMTNGAATIARRTLEIAAARRQA
jgi:hypothetical protein